MTVYSSFSKYDQLNNDIVNNGDVKRKYQDVTPSRVYNNYKPEY